MTSEAFLWDRLLTLVSAEFVSYFVCDAAKNASAYVVGISDCCLDRARSVLI